MDRSQLTRIDPFTWEVPETYHEAMRVPVHILATDDLVDDVLAGEALQQAVHTAMLPGIVGHLVVMPDVYSGQGAPFGCVAATKYPVGAIAPGAIGYDINTGVRLLGSKIKLKNVDDALDALADALQAHIPCGADAEGALHLSSSEVDHVAQSGAQWALRKDMAVQDDLVRTEEGGRLNESNATKVSDAAQALGARQLGTLGGGQHFIEMGVVEEVHNLAASRTMGLRDGRLTVLIHCGSRGFGRQVCADYLERFQKVAKKKYDIEAPTPELASVPLDSKEAEDYMGAMKAAANYAYANRQVLAFRVREAFKEVLGDDANLSTVYDVAHCLGQLEMHDVGGKQLRCYVHRKGAARAFGPGTPGISLPYRALGQPVIVPGSRGETSWVLLAMRGSMQRSFGSACHGAGRTMSRHEAGRAGLLDETAENVRVRAADGDDDGAAVQVKENIDAVVDTVVGAKIASKVARIRPLAVVHG